MFDGRRSGDVLPTGQSAIQQASGLRYRSDESPIFLFVTFVYLVGAGYDFKNEWPD
jgi:hypothetical protein